MEIDSCFYYYLISVSLLQVYAKCIQEHLLHGSVTIQTHPYYSVHYECDEGYNLFGVSDAYCFNGVWSTPVPICHAKGCKVEGYTEVPNGDIAVISDSSLIIVTCKPGFIMDGESTISCDGRAWSEPLPTCYSAVDIEHCNFEHQSFCGWTQEYKDYPDWELHSGETETKRTGPKYDHTLGPERNDGHYIYMESSIPRQYGHISRLLSPVFPPDKSKRCFQLWYHMLGPEEPEYMGDLEILLRFPDGLKYVEEELFLVSGNQGDEWHKADVFIEQQNSDFQIVVQATRGRSHTSDIAVDDFSIYRCTNDSDVDVKHSTTSTTTTSETGGNSSNHSSTVDLQIQKNKALSKALSDLFYGSKSAVKTSEKYIPDTIPIDHSTQVTSTIKSSVSSTVKTVTLPVNSGLDIFTKAKTDELPPIHYTTENVHIATENFIIYPVDIGHPSENMSDNKNKEFEKVEDSVGNTLGSNESKFQESFIFNPAFIVVMVGLCLAALLAVVVISVLIHRRRRIWGRKTSDDQFTVLYSKNTQLKSPEALQSV